MGWANHRTYLNDRQSLWTNFSRSHLSQLLERWPHHKSVTRLCNGVITSPPDAGEIEYDLLDKDETFALLKKTATHQPGRLSFCASLEAATAGV